MKTIVMFVLVAFIAVTAYLIQQPKAPLRGMAMTRFASQPVLTASAKPVAMLVPGADFAFSQAGWRSVTPMTRILMPGDARVNFALYDSQKEHDAILVTAIADAAANKWEWESAHHSPYPVLWQTSEEETRTKVLHESLYIMPADADPFLETKEMGKDTRILVYRQKLRINFNKTLLIAEYHAMLNTHETGELTMKNEYLQNFLASSRTTCKVVFPEEGDMEDVKLHMEALGTADKDFSRQKLSRWCGEIHLLGSF